MGRGRGWIRIETLEKAIRRQQIWVLNIYELAALVAFSLRQDVPRQMESWWEEQRRRGASGAGGKVTGCGGAGTRGDAGSVRRRKDKWGAIKVTVISQENSAEERWSN